MISEREIYARAYTKKVKTYSRDKIDKTLGSINNQIEAYRKLYRTKPKLILISKELELLFKEQINLMSQYEMVMLNDEPLEINRVFGLSCISTPALSDLHFEVR